MTWAARRKIEYYHKNENAVRFPHAVQYLSLPCPHRVPFIGLYSVCGARLTYSAMLNSEKRRLSLRNSGFDHVYRIEQVAAAVPGHQAPKIPHLPGGEWIP